MLVRIPPEMSRRVRKGQSVLIGISFHIPYRWATSVFRGIPVRYDEGYRTVVFILSKSIVRIPYGVKILCHFFSEMS